MIAVEPTDTDFWGDNSWRIESGPTAIIATANIAHSSGQANGYRLSGGHRLKALRHLLKAD